MVLPQAIHSSMESRRHDMAILGHIAMLWYHLRVLAGRSRCDTADGLWQLNQNLAGAIKASYRWSCDIRRRIYIISSRHSPAAEEFSHDLAQPINLVNILTATTLNYFSP